MAEKKPKQQESDLPKLAAPAVRALTGAGLTTLEAVSKKTSYQLLELHGIGQNAIETLRAALVERGMALAGEASVTSELPTNIGRVATRELAIHGYARLDQLTKVSEADLLAIHGVGKTAIERLKVAMAEKGLSFAEPKTKK